VDRTAPGLQPFGKSRLSDSRMAGGWAEALAPAHEGMDSAPLERREVDLLRDAQELVEEHPGPVQGLLILADYDVLQI